MIEEPQPRVLRHRDSGRQAFMFGSFAVIVFAIPAIAFLTGSAARWWLLVLVPLGAVAGYASLRLATLRVILDSRGIVEPAPLRPTVLTPWSDVVRIRRTEDPGAIGLSFLGVSIEHKGGWRHQVVALNINTRDPLAEPTVGGWIEAIRAAKRDFSSS